MDSIGFVFITSPSSARATEILVLQSMSDIWLCHFVVSVTPC